jgi:Calx-beta domain
LPNNGTLNTIAVFGVPNATHVGFDIAPDGIGFVAGKHSVPDTPVEYILAELDPLTGEGESHGVIGDGTIPIRDIAVAPTISFSAPEYAIAENGGSALITVKREGFLNTTVSVQYSTFSDTASAGSDYTTVSGTLTFAATEDTKTFSVPIIDDAFPEDDEFVGLLLLNVTGSAVIGAPGIATLRINANDRVDVVPPRITFIGLTGPSRGINGAVIHFNEDMNPASVVDLGNYKLKVFASDGTSQVMLFDGAIYDPVGRTVTLSLDPFMQTDFDKMAIRVNAKHGGVTDLAGNRLDGDRNGLAGGDAVQIFDVFSGTTLKFVDRDGDLVKLKLAGPGQLDGVRPLGGPKTQRTQFWILDPVSLVTTLNGTVKRSSTGDGIVVIAEIIGLDKKEITPLLTNPTFKINRLTFSSTATGL